MHSPDATTSRQWWQPWEVPDQHRLSLELGPLGLELHRGGGEWRLSWRHEEELDTSTQVRACLLEGMSETEQGERYVFSQSSNRVRLRPMLMDRPVVVRPREPVFLPSGEEITLYLSTPLCLGIDVGEHAVRLREIPMLPLSDTWFGPSTREGELCYSGRTHARHSLDESLLLRPHRALTPARIRNEALSPLALEKLSLPVPVLSVFGGEDGSLWTEGLSLVRSSDTELARMRIEHGPARYARNALLIGEPRRASERGGLVRAFSEFFGN